MPSPNATPTPITPPRVPLIDPRTGLIDRAWYLFFLSLNQIATNVVDDVVGPDAESLIASYDAALRSVNQELQTLPPAIDYSEDILKIRHEGNLQPLSEVGELQAQINDVKQELETLPRSELGTMAALQQANLPWVTFDTTPESVPTDIGTVAWDGGTTLGVQMTTNVLGRVNESGYYYIKASSAITLGQVIMFTGAVGASGVPTGAPATGITDGSYIMGIAAENIANNGFGLVQFLGTLRGFNLSAYADGDILWYDPAVTGGLTKTKPSAPNVKVQMAAVISNSNNGTMLIRVDPGSELGGTDSNVQFGTLVTNDLIQYNGTYWTNVTPASVIASSGGAPITKTADFTVANGETWFINNKSGSTCTVTLPAASSYTGRTLTFKNMQAQTLVSASSNVVPIDSTVAGTAILLAVVGNWATMVSDGTNWVIMQQAANNCLLLE